MKRRPDRLTGMRNSLGRRVIEPESFVSSSCVGDQLQHLKRHLIETMASARHTASTGQPLRASHGKCEPPAIFKNHHTRPGSPLGDRMRIVVKEAHERQVSGSVVSC